MFLCATGIGYAPTRVEGSLGKEKNELKADDSGSTAFVPIESPHNGMHLAIDIGGYIYDVPDKGYNTEILDANGDTSESEKTAFDPIFFSHHCWIDLVFWRWQEKNGLEKHADMIDQYPGTKSIDSQSRRPALILTATRILSISEISSKRKRHSRPISTIFLSSSCNPLKSLSLFQKPGAIFQCDGEEGMLDVVVYDQKKKDGYGKRQKGLLDPGEPVQEPMVKREIELGSDRLERLLSRLVIQRDGLNKPVQITSRWKTKSQQPMPRPYYYVGPKSARSSTRRFQGYEAVPELPAPSYKATDEDSDYKVLAPHAVSEVSAVSRSKAQAAVSNRSLGKGPYQLDDCILDNLNQTDYALVVLQRWRGLQTLESISYLLCLDLEVVEAVMGPKELRTRSTFTSFSALLHLYNSSQRFHIPYFLSMQLLSKPTGAAVSVLLLLPGLVSAATDQCPLHGALLPTPKTLSTSKSIASAGAKLSSTLDTLMTSKEAPKEYPWLSQNTTSFSIILTDADNVLYEYHHSASGTLEGTKKVNKDSVYRVGSVTKVFAGLLGWKMGIDWDQTLDKILPELANSTGPVEWDKITMEMLVGHMSGLPRWYGFPEQFSAVKNLMKMGFREIGVEDLPICNMMGVNADCTRETLLKAMNQISPVSAPGYRAVYSNLAYAVLGLAYETLGGGKHTFEQLLQKYVLEPTGMKSSFMNLPKNRKTSDAVIPPLPSNFWNFDMGTFGAAGGLFSTPSDMTKFMQSLLSHEILDKTTYQTFLKPRTMIGGSKSSLVGNPWEIVRGNILKKTPKRITDVYAKDGGVIGYTSRVGIIEDYGIGFIVMSAAASGGEKLVNALSEAVIGSFIDVVEDETKKEAKKNGYVGDFGNGDGKKGVSLRVEEGSEGGLVVTGFTDGKANMLDATVAYSKGGKSGSDFEFRLFPSGIVSKDPKTGEELEEWRLLSQPKSKKVDNGRKGKGGFKLPSSGVYDGYEECVTWATQDNVSYGGEGLERVIFTKKDGKVVKVELPAYRIQAQRNPVKKN
ncbi:beta-lactamase/transpeptidase-like protein [Ascobolus immersus RN42]|uniref:Beta-lactamase/transpeptidase-like protein n=1 Tax=Ascobolus immersus RN42 TaxID=1160509 RepID=A0A3N4IFD6_ASCIM|nr:beta-lactamase/transpeptidase-like protein [Ascobolus immersus RN42]